MTPNEQIAVIQARARGEITAQRLREVLCYCQDTGLFRWRAKIGNRAQVGEIAGGHNTRGYLAIQVDGKIYLSHRLAWLYLTGSHPKDQIDHINGVRDDNRAANLREANNTKNSQNQHHAHSNNKSGFLGVSWHKKTRKWVAQIKCGGKPLHIGYFNDPQEASNAYFASKSQLHPGWTRATWLDGEMEE